jgi:hypothetical protein
MKRKLTVVFCLIAGSCFGQGLDSCGLDSNPILNDYEAVYLNAYFKDAKKGFDFMGKRIAFVTGSLGSEIGTKSEYFKDVKTWASHNHKVADDLIVFTEDERLQSGGYDAIVAYWTKVGSGLNHKKIIKKLKTTN